jgi:hypothetical protein
MREWLNLTTDDILRLRLTPPLVSFLVGWLEATGDQWPVCKHSNNLTSNHQPASHTSIMRENWQLPTSLNEPNLGYVSLECFFIVIINLFVFSIRNFRNPKQWYIILVLPRKPWFRQIFSISRNMYLKLAEYYTSREMCTGVFSSFHCCMQFTVATGSEVKENCV